MSSFGVFPITFLGVAPKAKFERKSVYYEGKLQPIDKKANPQERVFTSVPVFGVFLLRSVKMPPFASVVLGPFNMLHQLCSST